jgi:hypothetical protein
MSVNSCQQSVMTTRPTYHDRPDPAAKERKKRTKTAPAADDAGQAYQQAAHTAHTANTCPAPTHAPHCLAPATRALPTRLPTQHSTQPPATSVQRNTPRLLQHTSGCKGCLPTQTHSTPLCSTHPGSVHTLLTLYTAYTPACPAITHTSHCYTASRASSYSCQLQMAALQGQTFLHPVHGTTSCAWTAPDSCLTDRWGSEGRRMRGTPSAPHCCCSP